MKMSLLYLIFIGCAFGALADDSDWDQLVDSGLDAAKDDLIKNHFDIISIPEISKDLRLKVIGIPINIALKINGAEFWNTTSVSRRSHVTVLQDDKTGNITFSLALGLDQFYFSVKNLYLHVIATTISGSLSSHCGKNEVEFSLSIIQDDEGNCKAEMNWARITKLSDVSVTLKPTGIVNWFAEHILSFILNHFAYKIIPKVNNDLTNEVNNVLSKIDICSYMPI